MRRSYMPQSSYWVGLVALVAVQLADAQTLGKVTFQCPAKVKVQDAVFDNPKDLQGFSARFSPQSVAHLSRITIQEGSGKEASDIKPRVTRERRIWELPQDRQEPTSVWCHYEGGVALARVLRPNIAKCEAEMEDPNERLRDGSGRPVAGLGRIEVACE